MCPAFVAAALVGTEAIRAENPSGNTVVLLLAAELGGSFLLSLVVCLAFPTVLAVVAGVAPAAAISLAHDIYGVVVTRDTASAQRELFVARVAAVVVGTSATVPVLIARNLNVSFLIGLAISVSLVGLSPGVSGNASALPPGLDLSVFPCHNPAIVSVPVRFLLGRLGSAPFREADRRASLENRVTTGVPPRG